MRVAVTGASGFIGRKVVNHLVSKGHKVISVGGNDPKIAGVQHNNWSVQKKTNVIVHCAAEENDWLPTSGEEEFLDENVSLSIDQVIAINPNARFILLSSSAVYQTSEGKFNPVEELIENETAMLSALAASKALREHLTVKKVKDERYYILRPRAVYGEDEPHLLPRLEEYAKGYFILPGKNPKGSLTNVKTLCEVVEFFVNDVKEKNFGIYNVADGAPVDTHQIITELIDKRGHKAKLFRLPYAIAYKSALAMENKARKKNLVPMATRSLIADIGRDSVMNVAKLEAVMGRKLPETDISDGADW